MTVGKATGQPKLGKGTAFAKSQLKTLEQADTTWEADFRAMPKPQGQTETHYLGLVVSTPQGNPLVCIPVDYTPDVNDLADLLAAAMRRPMTDTAYTRLHNADLVGMLKEYATDFTPLQAGFNGATGLYCGEQDLFCILIDPAG